MNQISSRDASVGLATMAGTAAGAELPERWTLMAISALAYVLALALHEHGGHSLACVLAGSHPREMSAFYVDCDDAALGELGRRAVALAGPAMSLMLGLAGFAVAPRVPSGARAARYFCWLLGSLGLMEAAGYPLFSGASGLGDLGTTRDGVLAGASPEWLWRGALFAAGVLAYRLVLRILWQRLAPELAGQATAQLQAAARCLRWSYFTGAAVYLAIGLFNPLGWQMVLMSVLPSSLGGTCGLLFVTRIGARRPLACAPGPGLAFGRSGAWIGAALATVLLYAVLFAGSLRFA
jgi:hypothetical protein